MIAMSIKFWYWIRLEKRERAAPLTAPPPPPRANAVLLRIPCVRDSRRCPVELRQMDGERLVVGPGLVLEEAERDRLSQEQRRVGVAAPVDTGVDSMTERHVVSQLIQLAIHGELPGVRSRVRHERQAISRRYHRIGDHEIPVEEKFQQGDAGPANGAVTG